MIARDLGWRVAAVVISLLIHFTLLQTWSGHTLIAAKETQQPPNQLFVQIDFPQPKPESIMPIDQPPVEQPVSDPPPKPKPKPKPKPVHKPKPKPVQTPVEKPKEPEEVVEETQESPPPPPAASRQLVDLKNQYISELLAKIEKNKFYPTIARRRNLQGMIQVRFRLGCQGEVESLEIEGKHSLLRKAAGKAIEASMPLPKIPAEIECPVLIDYAMAYKLEK